MHAPFGVIAFERLFIQGSENVGFQLEDSSAISDDIQSSDKRFVDTNSVHNSSYKWKTTANGAKFLVLLALVFRLPIYF